MKRTDDGKTCWYHENGGFFGSPCGDLANQNITFNPETGRVRTISGKCVDMNNKEVECVAPDTLWVFAGSKIVNKTNGYSIPIPKV
jgi:hypothetical protein